MYLWHIFWSVTACGHYILSLYEQKQCCVQEISNFRLHYYFKNCSKGLSSLYIIWACHITSPLAQVRNIHLPSLQIFSC